MKCIKPTLLLLIITFSNIHFSCQYSPKPASNPLIVKGKLGVKLDTVITPYVNTLRELTNNNTGLAIGVTKGENIVYAKTFGHANIEDQIKADLHSVFHIASVTKPFTAVAITKLIQDGKLALNDLLIDHIPEFKMKDENYKSITLKHILTHTSGIPRHVSSGDWEKPVVGPHALDTNLEKVAQFNLDFIPGSKFNYSNSAIDILGIVISRVSNMPFDEYVVEQILRPTGMNDTHFKKPVNELPVDWAKPYSYGLTDQEWSPYPYTENYFPSSGIQTSILDMCTWGMLHTNKGKINGVQLLNEESYDLLTSPHYDTPWGGKIGLGWFLQEYLDRPIIMHTGNDTGFESVMYIYPEEDISISVLANRDFSRTARIVNAISEVIFDQQPKEYNVSAKYPFAEAYREGGIEQAIGKWEELSKDTTDIYSADFDDVLTTGAILENGQKYKEAKEILEYYLTGNDKSTYAWRLLGNSHLHLKDTTMAVSCYKKCLEINPDYEKATEALEKL